MTGAPIAHPDSAAVGQQLPPFSRLVTQEQVNAYAEASGDHNPIHLDPDFARAVGLPGTIAHGLLEMGIVAEGVARWAGGYDRLASLGARFSRPLLPGQTLTLLGSVVEVNQAEGLVSLTLEAVSSAGDRVLTNGRATVRQSR